MAGAVASAAPLIQGVPSPAVVVNPQAFYQATRRMRFPMQSRKAIAGIGSNDSVQLRQTGIVAALEVRVSGNITFGGTITGTTMGYEWPFNLVRSFSLSANGQSNLINARGLAIRALEFAANDKITDQGISKTFGASTGQVAGTLAFPCDNWGTVSSNNMYPGAAVPATGTYAVDITYVIPVAADPVSLVGAVYAQSSATNLTLSIQWATQAQLLTLGGSATVDFSALQWEVQGVVYTIPNVGGQFVVPDLSQFHQVTEFQQTGLGSGLNEINLPGVGIGRYLMRIITNVYSSSTPLAVNDTNFSTIGWAFGGSDVPESFPRGGPQRALNFRQTGVDMGALWGLILLDFASEHALRDIIDEGTVSDLRVQLGLVSSPTNGYAVVCQETLFAAPVGA